MVPDRKSQREAARLRPLLTIKKILKTSTWKFRTLYEAGRTTQVPSAGDGRITAFHYGV